MQQSHAAKIRNLTQAGLLNPAPEQVNSPLFGKHPDFFDAHDKLQVRYEMLRAHLVDGKSVVEICAHFGVSRQTFYILQEKFLEEGSPGLLPKKPGPKGPVKLRPKVLAFVRERIESRRDLSATQLLSEIEEKFAVSLHRRTIEKLVKKLVSKKNT